MIVALCALCVTVMRSTSLALFIDIVISNIILTRRINHRINIKRTIISLSIIFMECPTKI